MQVPEMIESGKKKIMDDTNGNLDYWYIFLKRTNLER